MPDDSLIAKQPEKHDQKKVQIRHYFLYFTAVRSLNATVIHTHRQYMFRNKLTDPIILIASYLSELFLFRCCSYSVIFFALQNIIQPKLVVSGWQREWLKTERRQKNKNTSHCWYALFWNKNFSYVRGRRCIHRQFNSKIHKSSSQRNLVVLFGWFHSKPHYPPPPLSARTFLSSFFLSAIRYQTNKYNKGEEVRNIQSEHVQFFFFFFSCSSCRSIFSRFFSSFQASHSHLHTHTQHTHINHLLYIELCQLNLFHSFCFA